MCSCLEFGTSNNYEEVWWSFKEVFGGLLRRCGGLLGGVVVFKEVWWSSG